jgi:CHASE3 domain sensor protein
MTHNPYQDQLDSLTRRIQEAENFMRDPDLKELAAAEVQQLRQQIGRAHV